MKNFIIAGLGNPDDKYKETRHNIGFKVIDNFNEKFKIGDKNIWKKEVEIISGVFKENKIYLVKPITYMNNSGISLKKFMDFYNFNIEDLLVIFDDISLELGKIRLKRNGSSAGHNGVKNIIENFSTSDIKRLKIGIGPKPEKIELKNFVLTSFNKSDKENLNKIFLLTNNILETYIEKGIDFSMNKFNS